ncbi:MAG: alpha-amylase family glycosyl hydrolase [Saprospiraceae bacterium]
MKKISSSVSLFLILAASCSIPKNTSQTTSGKTPFLWQNANIYFLLTDRFQNGDKSNDVNFGRTAPTATLRGFMGGDIKGIAQKIDDGYFDRLGITAIWFTPVVEQIHAPVNEGTGNTYGFHGYWAKDWTRLDPNFGTEKDLAQLVQTAHAHGIRIVLDGVINHTGPATAQDPLWADWARTGPRCTYTSYASTTACTLVDNLPDIFTESDKPVDLPPFLKEKWRKEGRLEKETAELDAFFKRTGYPRAPRFYLIKWLCDYIRKYGVDGYRCDTAKHIEESVWGEFRKEADIAFSDWKRANPAKVLDGNGFYMVGEVYNYFISGGRLFDFGDKKVDFFANGFDALLNFDLKNDAQKTSYEAIFSKYDNLLHTELKGKGVLNYLSSHDDGGPYDKMRRKPMEAGTKLLLCPGASQVYYGDETARSLDIPGTEGDATLRSFMNWEELAANAERNGFKTQDVLAHWQKLGRFRKAHPAVGAGQHTMLTANPYTFKRVYKSGNYTDAVVVGLDLPKGKKTLEVGGVFADRTAVMDYYSGQKLSVSGGKVSVDSEWGVVLLGR